jgi:predicted nucleic acid-binding Zn ribbon protein
MMSQSRRFTDANTIAEIINLIIEQNKLKKGLQNVQITEIWKDKMGQGVVNYTEKVQLKGSTLTIQLNSSVLREELNYGKEKIIQMVNEALGNEVIKNIKWL